MRIRKCTHNDLFIALEKVNEKFAGNICFADGTPHRYANRDKDWRVRLGVHDSRGIGAKISIRYFGLEGEQHLRRSHSACWHVHGHFFDALPTGTSIQSRGETIHAGDDWVDFNVGSRMYPVYASESCLCEGEVDQKWAKSNYEKSKASSFC